LDPLVTWTASHRIAVLQQETTIGLRIARTPVNDLDRLIALRQHSSVGQPIPEVVRPEKEDKFQGEMSESQVCDLLAGGTAAERSSIEDREITALAPTGYDKVRPGTKLGGNPGRTPCGGPVTRSDDSVVIEMLIVMSLSPTRLCDHICPTIRNKSLILN
jgi:hypothetical protein